MRIVERYFTKQEFFKEDKEYDWRKMNEPFITGFLFGIGFLLAKTLAEICDVIGGALWIKIHNWRMRKRATQILHQFLERNAWRKLS